jgi:methylenetetrahydrofolate reductase (NADPH)
MRAVSTEVEPASRSGKSLLSGYSIEITAKDAASLEEVAALLPARTRVSVTFLPNEDFPARVSAARRARELGFIPVPHLSARRLKSSQELERYLDRLASEAGLDHCFVVAGDLDQPEGSYHDALSLIRSGLLEKYGVRHVGISGYPEGHPNISDAVLQRSMWEKQSAAYERGLALSIITQFGFDASPALGWLERLREDGIQAPVYIGIAGAASVQTLLRFAARCGVTTSAKVMSKYGLSLTQLFTSAGPDSIVSDLQRSLQHARHGDASLHFYPFGGLARTINWIRDFSRDQR